MQQHDGLECKALCIVFQHAKTQRIAAGRVMCGGCGCGLHESDVWRCASCNQDVCFDAGGDCMSRGGVGVGGVDVCNARMYQPYQCCGACGNATHEERLMYADGG
jgi:hypothetical protein